MFSTVDYSVVVQKHTRCLSVCLSNSEIGLCSIPPLTPPSHRITVSTSSTAAWCSLQAKVQVLTFKYQPQPKAKSPSL